VSIGLVTGLAATGGINNLITGMAVKSFLHLEVGDRIDLGGKLGDIVDITNIGIKVRNPKGEVIMIPHNELLRENLVNLTKSAPVAIAVEATIGYDVPHEDVEGLMLRAAKETRGVLEDPSPRTLLLDMEDYYIRYQLRAFVNDVKNIPDIKSELIRKCHRLFYENGVEIMSPAYEVQRNLSPPTREELREYVRPKVT
jgi:small-conductance mechanosensitive channel